MIPMIWTNINCFLGEKVFSKVFFKKKAEKQYHCHFYLLSRNKMNAALRDVIQAPQLNTDGWENNLINHLSELI